MVRPFAWVVVSWFWTSSSLSGQFNLLESTLSRWVNDGALTTDQAETITAHIQLHGAPSSPYEAYAISGLDSSTANWLAVQSDWKLLCAASSEASGGQGLAIRLDSDTRTATRREAAEYVLPTAWSIRIQRSGAWTLRLDPSRSDPEKIHVAGHAIFRPFRRSFPGLKLLVGDHAFHWGQGASIGVSSLFDGLRSPVAVLRNSRWVVPMGAGPSVEPRSGVVLWSEAEGGARVLGFDHGRWTGLWMRKSEGIGWGVLGQIHPHHPHLLGTFVKGALGNWVFGAEATGFPGGWSGRLGAVGTLHKHVDVFVRWNRGHAAHPGRSWGETGLDPDGVEMWMGWEWRHPQTRQDKTWCAFKRSADGVWRFETEWRHRTALRWDLTFRQRWISPDDPWSLQLAFRRDDEDAGIRKRFRLDAIREGAHWGTAGTALLGFHGKVKWDVGWTVCRSGDTGAAFYLLLPRARGWSTQYFSGNVSRFVVNARLKVGRKGSLSASGHWGTRSDDWQWGDGADGVEGSNRFGLQIRLAFG